MKVSIVCGDISQVKADALITAINSGGMWFGGIDSVIQRCAGNAFHNQAAAASPLKDGQTIVARGNGSTNRGRAFENVVFVVDDLQQKLQDVVFAALGAAEEAGFRTVSMPTIRMGVMLGAVEKTAQEAVQEMVEGIRKFGEAKKVKGLNELTIVVYDDQPTANLFREHFRGSN